MKIILSPLNIAIAFFLAFYSKRYDKHSSWLLTMKQLYEYIKTNMKSILIKRGWRNSIKQTLVTIPCFIKTKHDLIKSYSVWTIDPYYRPLLIKAYLTRMSLQSSNP